ncbi:MAG TPA: 3-dehydroquinate synthase [Candidatus Pacearchaeota archaeon]|nr:3-dehydroquinate synthase [Candidatus Pacearchaeota archaeon]
MNIKIENGCVLGKGLPEGFVITDKNVFEKYGSLVKGEKFIIGVGEKSKSLEVYGEILKELGDTKRIIALGGGVVGDLVGFVASTYKRGIDLIQVPTTLLAMVDSSIGGKTGINLGEKKNYVGTFYQASGVLIDLLFLEKLPEEEFRNGVAEIVKYGLVFGVPSLERLEKGIFLTDEDLSEIISQCVDYKVEVVGKDKLDKGFRHVLNFGHTIGHAIELVFSLRHGEAISIGILIEMKLGKMKGIFTDEQINVAEKILKKNGLPVYLPVNLDIDNMISLMKQDKKGSLVFSFNEENQEVVFDESEIREVLENG